MALHSSDSLVASLKHVARPVWVHSSLIRYADQDGELFAVNRIILRSDCGPVRDAEVVVSPPDGQGMPARYV